MGEEHLEDVKFIDIETGEVVMEIQSVKKLSFSETEEDHLTLYGKGEDTFNFN